MKLQVVFKYIFSTIFVTILCLNVTAQNITGTWEGYMRNEFLQINVQQSGTTLCGFTYDYVLEDKANHCRAYYTGRYEDGFVLFTGTSFIENSGSHVLMTIGLLTSYEGGQLVLKGRVDTRTLSDAFLTDKNDEVITLRRSSPFPRNAPGTNQACFTPTPEKEADSAPVPRPSMKPALPKPLPTPPKPKPTATKASPATVKPKPFPTTNKPEVKPEMVKPIIVAPIELPAKIKGRKQDEQGKIIVKTKTINLKIYDNGEVDGDTVTVYFDGKLIVNQQRLSEKPIEITLTLDDNVDVHRLTLFADNLGSIPPNTALIVVTAGKKRFELRSDADMKKNAVLLFKYEPE